MPCTCSVPGLLSADQVASVHGFASRVGSSCGSVARRRDPLSGVAAWSTTYLSTDLQFQQALPDVVEAIRCAVDAADSAELYFPLPSRGTHPATINSSATFPSALGTSNRRGDRRGLGLRCCEYHTVQQGGELKHAKHYDSGSVFTIDIMLSTPDEDFGGGNFVAAGDFATVGAHHTHDADPHRAFRRPGDGIVFVSHKMHNVRPVTWGIRHVLVCELWEGPDKGCGHRCEFATDTGCGTAKHAAALIEDALGEFDAETAAAAMRFLKVMP
jgi:hypothetical protein